MPEVFRQKITHENDDVLDIGHLRFHKKIDQIKQPIYCRGMWSTM